MTSTTSAERVTGAEVRRRLAEAGHRLPVAWKLPERIAIPSSLIRVIDNEVFVSGHVPIDADGEVDEVSGRVGAEVDLAGAQQAAIKTLLGILADLEREIGDLGRIRAWRRLYCMASATPEFTDFPGVFNPASQLLVTAFGREIGTHARVAIGVAGLPWNKPVEIEAQLVLHAQSAE
ncbi:RidA family protein [Nocardia terpenica]|uniref:Uncharacterized protein n=1 Tax=Nocardia terpenica TaxID=455432 RepID=A0A164PIA6_9NOCA|nr:RidA family protein [Nocardia terpenica]KZM75607.1 hypothetical protein AWN90_19775 [Nocardia terpenica]NQE86095.1 RidA family protein [Nocardia terpenica]